MKNKNTLNILKDDYNEKDMSTEDAKYYLDVTNRINKKMLDLYN